MIKQKKKFEIEPDTLIKRDSEQEFTYIDGEIVMLSLKNGEYYGLDEVGTRIWELLESPLMFNDLINYLLEEYNITRDECETDTRSYLEDLYEKKLVRI